MRETFSCSRAISRNVGCVGVKEQDVFRRKRAAVAGDVYLSTLARLGISVFNIQMGASVSNIGTLEVDSQAARVKDVDPEVDVENFSLGCVSQEARVHLEPRRIILPLQRITLMIQIRQIARLRSKS